LRAAEKLQSVLDGRDRGTDVLELKVQLDLIGKAVRAVVPQQMWAEIIAKLEELEQEQHAESLDVGTAPSMTLTLMTPTTRPSSSTRTTSFDLRNARRHRKRSAPLPVFTVRSRDAGQGNQLGPAHRTAAW
jgi:hypothetical protein